MEKCSRCDRSAEEVRLFDGISVNDSIKICEKCSLIAGVPIIKRPSTSQLKDSERPYGVRERLNRMAHLAKNEKKIKSSYEEIKELESRPELEQPEDLVFKLVDNFHWIIQTERRRKGLSPKQLADAIHESESAIKMLERGIVPSKSIDLIRTLEQFLKVRLIRRDLLDALEEKKLEEEKVNRFILQKKNEIIKKQDSLVLGVRPTSRTSQDSRVRDLQRQSDNINRDFSFSKKSSEDIGKEQMEDIGKEDTDYIKRKVYGEKPKSRPPSIYDLMKKKEERDRGVLGRDIEILEDKPKDI
jgi:ribosome-binding protein aMBF1 (putative translation factor)